MTYPGWPGIDELKKLLDIDPESSDWDNPTMQRAIDAAIEKVKADVGKWDDLVNTITPSLSAAALRAAIIMQTNTPDPRAGFRFLDSPAALAIDGDPIYQGHLKGHRRRFAIS